MIDLLFIEVFILVVGLILGHLFWVDLESYFVSTLFLHNFKFILKSGQVEFDYKIR